MERPHKQPRTRHHAGFVRGADHVSGDDDMVGEEQSWLQLRFRPVTHDERFRAVRSRQEWGVCAELTEVGANLPGQLQALAVSSLLSDLSPIPSYKPGSQVRNPHRSPTFLPNEIAHRSNQSGFWRRRGRARYSTYRAINRTTGLRLMLIATADGETSGMQKQVKQLKRVGGDSSLRGAMV